MNFNLLFCSIFLIFLCSCKKPLAVFHWKKGGVRFVMKKKNNGDNAYGFPNHGFASKVICFDELCINKAVWMEKQKNMARKVKPTHKKHVPKTPLVPKIIAPDTAKQASITLTNSLPVGQEMAKPIEVIKPVENAAIVPIVPLNKVFVFNNLNFETGTSVVSRSSKSSLDTVIRILHENPELSIQIRGHTDNVGTENGNIKLSWERAESVSNLLIKSGIVKSRIKIQGFGSTNPLSATDRKINRRVEFYFIKN